MENPFKNLKINNYYSYLLVLGGFILVLSLFLESKIILQSKLVPLSIITIFYGLFEWIRENNHHNMVKNLNQKFLEEWEAASGNKSLDEIRDSSWDLNFKNNFLKRNKAEYLIPNYQIKTWVFFIVYIIVMIIVFSIT